MTSTRIVVVCRDPTPATQLVCLPSSLTARYGRRIAYAFAPMAPPKRKTGGGRVTPKGTQPGDRKVSSSGDRSDHDVTSSRSPVAASSRYTPKAQRRRLIPPNMIPVIMVALLIIGGVVIMAGYLVGDASRWFTGVGLACILGGLWFATKWE
jgi:hypothetical protein